MGHLGWVLVVLSPGQGAQKPGLLLPWLDLPGARERVTRWSALTELDLLDLGTRGTAEQIRDTAVAQPLLVATALLSARALLGEAVPGAVCGHSIGELAALAVAGVVSSDDAVVLAAQRGRAMADAAALAPTGMAAVLGGDPAQVAAAAQALGLEVATVNVAGQQVLGGPVETLDRFAADPPAGTRVKPLDVAGAFHTAAMGPARDRFATALAALRPRRALCPVVADADGEPVTDGPALLDRLAAQLTGPVRFDLCLQSLRRLGATAVVELAPAGTLTPLAKRALPGVRTAPLTGPDDLPAARALLDAEHGESPDVAWRVVAAAGPGVVDRVAATGDRLRGGDRLAVVSGRAGAQDVPAPHDGTLLEWLVSAGDPVRAGQPLAVLA